MRGACIAGLRLDGGGWIRPVGPTVYGELHPAHYLLQDGSSPQVFDRIRIALGEPQATAHQPENWLIADQPWQLVSRGLTEETAGLLESYLIEGPALLGDFSHKIPYDRFEREPAEASLCVIQPDNLKWTIDQLPYNAHKASAQFQLAGTSYRLPVTDPAWLDAFRALTPGKYPVTACGIPAEHQVLLTISLSDPWDDGYCYKLVAGILPVQAGVIGAPPEQPVEAGLDLRVAIWIVHALAGGIDPYTGEALAGGGPLEHPATIKALRAAEAALRSDGQRPRRELPAQAGKAWDAAEEELLARQFDTGTSLAEMAKAHGRTTGAIRSRLVKLGKMEG